MSPVPWQTGHIIQAQYLNSLQELLSDWSDNALLSATGAAVAINATPSAPAVVVVDGYMRTNTADEVANLSGPSGVYNIFATANRSTGGFDLSATPTAVTAAHSRLMGTADFNGVSVTDVDADVREINVSHLTGREPYESATTEGIPAGRSDATLDPAWIDDVEYNMVPIGGVRELWVPSGANPASQVPSGWALLEGQVLGVGQHSFPGVGAISLPDMRNRMSLGANPANVYGTPGNDSGTAPGVGGSGGDMAPRDLSHNHPVSAHAHTIANHAHEAGHMHFFAAHSHGLDLTTRRWKTSAGVGETVATSSILQTPGTRQNVRFNAPGDPAVFGPSPTHVHSGDFVGNTSNNTSTTGNPVSGGAVASAALASNDVTPWYEGLLYMMRVL